MRIPNRGFLGESPFLKIFGELPTFGELTQLANRLHLANCPYLANRQIYRFSDRTDLVRELPIPEFTDLDHDPEIYRLRSRNITVFLNINY